MRRARCLAFSNRAAAHFNNTRCRTDAKWHSQRRMHKISDGPDGQTERWCISARLGRWAPQREKNNTGWNGGARGDITARAHLHNGPWARAGIFRIVVSWIPENSRHTLHITTGFCSFNPPRASRDDSIWILYIYLFEWRKKMHVTHTHLHTERAARFVFSRVRACSPLQRWAKSLGVIENRHFEG